MEKSNRNNNSNQPVQLEMFPELAEQAKVQDKKQAVDQKKLDEMIHSTDEDIPFCRIYNIDWRSIL